MIQTLCFIDLETTGLNPKKCGIHQLSGIITNYNTKKNTNEIMESFNLKISPFSTDKVDEEAMKVCDTNEETIMQYQKPEEAHQTIINTFSKYVNRYDKKDKMYFLAYNAKFDEGFMRAWFDKLGDPYFGSWFFFPVLDIAGMAAFHLFEDRSGMDNFKLMTVAQEMGIEVEEEKAHDAMYDIEVSLEIFDKVMGTG